MSDQLPQGWTTSSLSDLLTALESGSRPRGGVRGITAGVPSIGGEHLKYDGKFDFGSVKFVPEHFAAEMTKGRIQTNDILVVKDGATTGKTAFVGPTFPFTNAVVNEHVFICRPVSEVEPRFLFRFLASRSGQKRILENFKGSAQGGINQTFAPNTEIPLAPLPEQRRIVAKLEALLAKVGACQQRLAKIPLLLKRFRQSVLAAACSGRLTADWREENSDIQPARDFVQSIQVDRKADYDRDCAGAASTGGRRPKRPKNEFSAVVNDDANGLPDLWCVTRIGDISDCLDNIRVPINRTERLARNGTIPYYGANGQVGWIDDFLFNEELVLVVEDETFIGREKPFSYVIKGKTWVNNHAHVLRALGGMPTNFLNICLSHYDFVPLTSGTTGRRKLTQASLVDAPLPVPPLPEQHEIVRRVETLFALADQIEARYTKAQQQVDKLTPSLLAKAFRGELVPQDPKDEPAQKLLERIQQSRAP
jgi:type I restriction enzyme, S subunit